jgi:hypothetical protein
MSVQRMRSVLKTFPKNAADLLGPFAKMAHEAGDRRWVRHVSQGFLPNPRKGKGPCVDGGPRSVREIAVATGYTPVAVRTAVQDMVLGRLIRETPGHPARYYAPEGIRVELLGGSTAGVATVSTPSWPKWRYWAQLFSFFAHVLSWAELAKEGNQGERVAATKARDLFKAHETVLHLNAIPVPDLSKSRGIQFLDGFEEVLRVTSSWAQEHL